jgi:phosphatidylinositol 3-kinase
LRKRLAEVDWIALGSVCYPIDVSVVLQQPIIEDCTVFSSAMAPMKLTFSIVGEKRFTFLFKSGDDLRQDQMVLEMFDLMDRLLKGVNQDYKLTPYKALACSKSDGFVEFVPETRTFQ